MPDSGLEVAGRAADNAGMRAFLATSLAAMLFAGGPSAAEDITVYRCVDGQGRVSLQNTPCAAGSTQTERRMARPQDAPPAPASAATSPPAPPEPEPALPPPPRPPPPPMYLCTSPDGKTRDSEVYDPNPRCEPLAVYYPDARGLTPEQAGACVWIEDSCLRLSDEAACQRFERKRRAAVSAEMHAFSDRAAYRKSELARLTQIVNDSCR